MPGDSDKKTPEKEESAARSCIDCGTENCGWRNSYYPEFCLTTHLEEQEIEEAMKLYQEPENQKIAVIAAQIESDFYCRYSRAEEIVVFCKRMGYNKIGIATCGGLLYEARIFARILRKNGLTPYGAACKVGSFDKTSIGVPPEDTVKTGPEMCNPILQARLLNKAKTDLNVVMGLCVGHDTLFYKYAEAPCTTLITKDRALGHNPAAALYQTQSYYRKLLERPVEDPREDTNPES